jgi:hypothetical protein
MLPLTLTRSVAMGLAVASPIALGLALHGCAKIEETSSSSARVFGSTGSTDDYADWTVDGNSLSAIWRVTTSTGAIARTLDIEAICGSATEQFGYKECTISSATCTAGTDA